MKAVDFSFPLFLPLSIYLVSTMCFWSPASKIMAVKDTPKGIEFILGEDSLVKIQEYTIPLSIRLKVPGPSDRMTMGSTTRVVQGCTQGWTKVPDSHHCRIAQVVPGGSCAVDAQCLTDDHRVLLRRWISGETSRVFRAFFS